jgi:hypothetical protein
MCALCGNGFHREPPVANVYGHLAPDYLQREIDRLSFGIAGPEVSTPESFAALVLQAWKAPSELQQRLQNRIGAVIGRGPLGASG